MHRKKKNIHENIYTSLFHFDFCIISTFYPDDAFNGYFNFCDIKMENHYFILKP